MKTRKLGSSGLEVSAIGMGAMPMSVRETRPSEADSIRTIHHALDCGITLIDTADSYCIDDREPGHNERLIGKALGQLPATTRDAITVATKGGLVRPGGRWERDGRPEHLREVCEQSLKNLQVECIDVYQYHAPDPAVPLADSLGELKKLQDEGKIAHVGVSNFSVEQLHEAMAILQIVSVQNQYAPTWRRPEEDGTLGESEKLELAFLPWSPLGGMSSAKSLGAGESVVESMAELHGVSPQQIALAWLLSKGPHVIPIPGASRPDTIEDSAKAADLALSADEIAKLDAAWA